MKITFLGTGTSQGVPVIGCECPVCKSKNSKDKRLRSSVLLSINNNNFVIDAGPDFRQQMLKHKMKKLRAILLTHEHVDHIFGLDDIRSFNWIQKRPTDIYCEKRVQKAIQRIFSYVFEKNKYPGVPRMNLNTIDNLPFYIDDIQFIPIRCLHHHLPVLGYRIGDFTYITDANYISKEELSKIKKTDVLVINALRKEKHISHFNLQQALEIIDIVNPKKAYLTHLSHTFGKHDDIQKILPKNVYIAYDGLVINL